MYFKQKLTALGLVLTVLCSFIACAPKEPAIDQEDQYRRIVFSLIAKRLDTRDFELLQVIPLHGSTNLIVIEGRAAEGNPYKRLYKADTNLIETKLTGEYLWEDEDLLGISVNTELIDGSTIVYGDIGNDHMSSIDKMLVAMKPASIELKFEHQSNLIKAVLYDGFYLSVLKNKSAVLQEVFFVNQGDDPENPTTFTYSMEYEYIQSLAPPELPTEPLYLSYEEGSDEWYLAKYVSPLVFTGILTDLSWTNPEVLPVDDFMTVFLALPQLDYTLDYSRFYEEDTGEYLIPSSVLEQTLGLYFAVTPAYLKKAAAYDEVTDSYRIANRVLMGEHFLTLEGVEPLDDKAFRLTVNAYNSAPMTEENLACTYVFTIAENGNRFHYQAYTYSKPDYEFAPEDWEIEEFP